MSFKYLKTNTFALIYLYCVYSSKIENKRNKKIKNLRLSVYA